MKMIIIRAPVRRTLPPLLVSTLLVAGCGSDDPGGQTRLAVVATTAIAADIARNVAGPDARVELLLPASANPHGYSASAKDRARLERAELVVAIGAGFEEGLSLEQLDRPPFELAENEPNPHVWMDPVRIRAQLPRLAGALGDADPARRAAYERRASAYGEQLARLDAYIRRTVARIPPARRKLVTSHEALGYFIRRYGFEFVGAPFGITPEAEASSERVARLAEKIERAGVPAVFADDSDDPKVLREVARAAGVEVVDDLLIEGLGPQGETYEAALRFDARRIAAALSR